MGDAPDGEAEKIVDLPHPLGVALGEVIVHCHHMGALAGQRVQIDRQRRDQRLALAGSHFCDRAPVQHNAAHELHVEMPLAKRPLGSLAHRGKSLRQQLVQRFARRMTVAQPVGTFLEGGVVERLDLRLEGIDGVYDSLKFLDVACVGASKDALGQRCKHRASLNRRISCRVCILAYKRASET